MIRTRVLCGVMLLASLAASSGQDPVGKHPLNQRRPDEPGMPSDQARTMEKARQQEEYKDMKRDAEKLLELATELKQEVDRSGQGTLSLNVVKKAEQIEKLARSVKHRMRGD